MPVGVLRKQAVTVLTGLLNGPVTIGKNSGTTSNSLLNLQNNPNPFNVSTVISWRQGAGSRQSAVRSRAKLEVYDFSGRMIRILVDSEITPGEHQVIFDASGLPAGVYFYKLQADGMVEAKKMLIERQ